jgi:hypothetical protein
MPNLAGLTKTQALTRVARLGIQWDTRGTGRVVSQEPPPGTPLAKVTLCRLTFGRERAGKTDAN